MMDRITARARFLFTTKRPERQSRNQSRNDLAQRRKDAKERKIFRTLRLGVLARENPSPKQFAQAAQIRSHSSTKDTKNHTTGSKKRPNSNMIFSSFVSFVVISPVSIDDEFWIKYEDCETVHSAGGKTSAEGLFVSA